jgi:hypothetical protein
MRAALGCSVTARGRYRLSMYAATIRAVPMTTAMKTERKDMAILLSKGEGKTAASEAVAVPT